MTQTQHSLASVVVGFLLSSALAFSSHAAPSKDLDFRLEEFGQFQSKPISLANGIDIETLHKTNLSEVIETLINEKVKQWSTDTAFHGTRTLVIQPEIAVLRAGSRHLLRQSQFQLRLHMTDITGTEIYVEPEFSLASNGIASLFTNGRSDARMYNQVAKSAEDYLDSLYRSAKERERIAREEIIAKRIEAAESGDVYAQLSLGNMYSDGKEVDQSDERAAAWWQRAAVGGNGDAQYSLGLAYSSGRGVTQDDQSAVAWLRKAAEQGHATAQWTLASMLDTGRGRAVTSDEALKWWRKAADQGIENAKAHLAQYQKRTPTSEARGESQRNLGTPASPDKAEESEVSSMIPFWLIAACLIVALFLSLSLYLDATAARTARDKAADIVDRHLATLVRLRLQLVTYDPYGAREDKKWNSEVLYFIRTQILPVLTSKEQRQLLKNSNDLASMVLNKVELEAEKTSRVLPFDPHDISPIEYEALCAAELRKGGWMTTLTKGSGDQGVDVIAERDGVRLILQCKLYSSPVGNKAVQEAAAGRGHQNADFAAVVSNSSFTKAARQLAGTNRILLLHHSQLATLDALDELLRQFNVAASSA